MADALGSEQEQMDITGPAGIGVSFKGSGLQISVIVVLLCALSVFGYISYNHNVSMEASQVKIEQHISETDETMQAMIYVLSLPESERIKLNLNKPKKLADMQR